MTLRTVLSAAALSLSLATPVAAAELKVGYVDYQRILLEVDEGKAAKNRLQGWLESRQKEIDREQEGLRKEKELLEKQASAMSEATRVQKSTELQKKVFDLAQKWEKARGEAQNKERQEMEPIVSRIDQVIAKLAERDGLSMVFEKRDSGIVYVLNQFDLTNEVVRNYNVLSKSKAPAKAAPAAAAKAPADAPKK